MKPLRRLGAILLTTLLLWGNLSGVAVPAALAASETETYFTILHTNDEHSALLPLPLIDYDAHNHAIGSAGGFARLASAVKQIRESKEAIDEPVLLLSAGDYLTGSPFAWLSLERRAAELSLMYDLGYDAVTIGNHEFDYGAGGLAAYYKAAGYPEIADEMPIVASNVQIPQGHALGEIGIKETYIKTLPNGLKLGFFGLIGKDAVDFTPYASPVTFGDQAEAAKEAVAELKAQGAEIIIALSHCGEEEEEDLANEVSGIDIIIGGHTHVTLEAPIRVNGTIIVQTGTQLSHLGILEVAYSAENGVSLRNEDNGLPYLLPLDNKVPFDELFAGKVAELALDLDSLLNRLTDGRFTNMDQAVLHTSFEISNKPELAESAFGNFVTDAMRLMAEKALGERVDFAFQANGVLRGGLEPGLLPGRAGQVALFDLVNLVGMGSGPDEEAGYPLVSFYFTGEEVRRVLEIMALLPQLKGDPFFLQTSGLRVEYDPDRAILAWVPVKNIPIPTTRAVLKAERYVGSGTQPTDGGGTWELLNRKDETLFHVVSDYYLAAFLPMVGDLLPSLGLVMKDKEGHPLKVDECIVYREGREYKVWQAVLEYAVSQPTRSGGIAEMPEYYREVGVRIIPISTLPILLLPGLAALFILLVLVFLIRRLRRRQRHIQGPIRYLR